jgi:hypothetical protein
MVGAAISSKVDHVSEVCAQKHPQFYLRSGWVGQLDLDMDQKGSKSQTLSRWIGNV